MIRLSGPPARCTSARRNIGDLNSRSCQLWGPHLDGRFERGDRSSPSARGWTQEVRLTSPSDQRLRGMVGA